MSREVGRLQNSYVVDTVVSRDSVLTRGPYGSSLNEEIWGKINSRPLSQYCSLYKVLVKETGIDKDVRNKVVYFGSQVQGKKGSY